MAAQPLKLVATGKDDGALKLLDILITKTIKAGDVQVKVAEDVAQKTVAATSWQVDNRKRLLEKQAAWEASWANRQPSLGPVTFPTGNSMTGKGPSNFTADQIASQEAARAAKGAANLESEAQNQRDLQMLARQKATAEKEIETQAWVKSEMLKLEVRGDSAIAAAEANSFERQRIVENQFFENKIAEYAGHLELIETLTTVHEEKMAAIAAREAAAVTAAIEKEAAARVAAEEASARQIVTIFNRTLGVKEGAAEAVLQRSGLGVGGVIGGTIAVGALAVAYEHTAKIAEEFRKADDGLAASLEESGKQAHLSVPQLKEYAEAIARTTQFDRDQAEAAESMLLSFSRLTSDQLPLLLKLSTDLAAKFGGDVADKARVVGIALQEPEKAVRALRQANIVLSESEQDKINKWAKTLDYAHAQAAVYDLLAQKAQGYAQSTVHASEILANQFREEEAAEGSRFLAVKEHLAQLVLASEPYLKMLGGILDAEQNVYGKEFADEKFHGMADIRKADDTQGFVGSNATSEDQRKSIAGLQDKINKARIEAMADGIQKALALEKLGYEDMLRDEGGFAEADAKITQLHQENVQRIKLQYAVSATNQLRRDSQEKTALQTRFYDDEDKRIQNYQSRRDSAKAQHDAYTFGRDLAKRDQERALEVKELDDSVANLDLSNAQYAEYQHARTALLAAQTEERINDIERERQKQIEQTNQINAANKKIAQGYLSIASTLADAFNIDPLKQALGWLQQILSVVTAIESIQAGTSALTTLSGGGGGIGILTSLFSAATFADGGPVYGPRHSSGGVPIIAEGGENIFSRDDVARAGGQANVEMMKRGGGSGVTHNGTVVIQVTVPGGASKESARNIGEQISVGYYEKMQSLDKGNRNIPYYRAQRVS